MKNIKLCAIIFTLYALAFSAMDLIFVNMLDQNIFFPYLVTKLIAFSMPVSTYLILRGYKLSNVAVSIVLMTIMVFPLIFGSYEFYLSIGGKY